MRTDTNDPATADDVIKLLDHKDAEIAKLRAENDDIRSRYLDCAGHNANLRAALEPLAAIVRKWSKDHLGGHIGDDDEVYVPCKLLFAADKALAEQEEERT